MPQRPNYRNQHGGHGQHPQGGGGPENQQLTDIPSPYYFVPLENRVWHPEGRVSHDVPFSDGISGSLKFEIEAMRPLYIRGTDERPDLPNGFQPGGNHPPALQKAIECWTEPYTVGRVPAIPGSSLRGVIRSVLKIVTSGSMKHADNTAISMRDLQLASYREKMTETIRQGERSGDYSPLTETGWLRERNDGSWELLPCQVSRVEQHDLQVGLGVQGLNQRQSLKEKYGKFGTEVPLPVRFRSDGKVALHAHSKGNQLEYDKVHRVGLNEEDEVGSLIVTGQPGSGKHMEFIFHSPPVHAIPENPEVIAVPKEVKDDFLATHHPGSEEVESWKFWRPLLKNGQWIPVFFLGDEGGIWAMGLAQMFRLAGSSRVHDGMPAAHHEDPPDFTDLLLGYVSKSDSLAGRVGFDHALCTSGAKPLQDPLWTVLGSPRASFYPNYLAQQPQPNTPNLLKRNGPKGTYDTWLSPEIRLRGWKRYAIHPDCTRDDPSALQVPPPPTVKGQTKYSAATAFRPLPPGASFRGSLRFHNLRPHELGALVWVLTWGGDDKLRHSLGMAKPLGFGSVKIMLADEADLKDASGNIHSLGDCRKAFETKLDSELPGWKTSSSLEELKALANPKIAEKVIAKNPDLLGYPAMEMAGENQFSKAKGGKNNDQLILPDYRVRAGLAQNNVEQALVPARRPTVRTSSPGNSIAPALANRPLPTGPPPLKIGEWLEGETIQVGLRLKFLPKDRPESEAGNIIHPPQDIEAGLKCKAKVNSVSSSGNTYKNLELQ